MPVRGANGELVTDADIVTGNAIIQVKSGGGKGLSGQVEATEKRDWSRDNRVRTRSKGVSGEGNAVQGSTGRH